MTASGEDELVFLPLGGAGEIGMNLNLYGYGPPDSRRWLIIDCGVTFGGDGIPGADVVMPDPSFIVERRDRLEGILLTHAHEDHLGAIPYLWPRLRCPVFATPFARAILRRKLEGTDLALQLQLAPIPASGLLRLGPFNLQLIAVTHSIPEAQAVVIRTDAGVLLHTGDWKLDPVPVIGSTTDEDALAALGDGGVTALIGDSTNVFEEGRSGSESAVRDALNRLVAGCPHRAVVTCFATNIARLQTIAEAARAVGRAVMISGASLKRNYAAARECGYLNDIPPFLDDSMADRLPRERSLIICTGGQGEPRSALSRIAHGEHPNVSLHAGDAIIFSSRVIPGNEPAIARVQNALLRQGVEVLTHRHGLIHVSGHPARDDLAHMYGLVRPRVAIPVHGELRHLVEHARLARQQHVGDALVVENGALVRLAPGPACIIDYVPVGKLLLEGNRAVPSDGELVRGRTKAISNGALTVTVVLERVRQAVQDVQIASFGLVEQNEEHLIETMREAVRKSMENMPFDQYDDEVAISATVRLAARRSARQSIDKRPLTHVHVVRV